MEFSHISTQKKQEQSGRSTYLHQYKVRIYKLLIVGTVTKPDNSLHLSIYWD